MPLIKGKSSNAFEHNVKAEMNAGKPQKQALAIAYATKRRAKRMATGGMVNDDSVKQPDIHVDDSFLSAEDGSETPFQDSGNVSDETELEESRFTPGNAAEVDNEEGNDMLSDIMQKVRRRQMRG